MYLIEVFLRKEPWSPFAPSTYPGAYARWGVGGIGGVVGIGRCAPACAPPESVADPAIAAGRGGVIEYGQVGR